MERRCLICDDPADRPGICERCFKLENQLNDWSTLKAVRYFRMLLEAKQFVMLSFPGKGPPGEKTARGG
jgi:hypothetical protein